LLTIASLVTLGLCAPGLPNDGPLVVRGEKVVIRPGEVLENAAVLVQDGLIVAVGTGIETPDGAEEITGKVVCAGFVDAWSSFGVLSDSVRELRSSHGTRTLDALDPYLDPDVRIGVLRSGVTALRVQAAGQAAEGGVGAFVRNHPGLPPEDTTLLEDCCVAVSVGITRQGRGVDTFDRIAEVDKVVGALNDGLAYLKSHNEYKYELEEWQKAIAEKEKELEKDFKKAKKDREKDEKEAEEKGKEYKPKKYKEDKKPKQPRFDEDKEVMGRVARGELPLVVEAHRAAELRNLLDGTEAFDRLRLIVAGGTEAMSVAGELAERGVPVIVWPQPLGANRLDELEQADLALAGRLQEAGVTVLLGTGATPSSQTRDLPLLASLAVGHGLEREKALEALTLGAARALDVSDRIGSLEQGKDADLLVLDGEPLSTTTRVQYVVSGGDVVVGP
jgi:imidazolonepropionase-like amidohydrolase